MALEGFEKETISPLPVAAAERVHGGQHWGRVRTCLAVLVENEVALPTGIEGRNVRFELAVRDEVPPLNFAVLGIFSDDGLPHEFAFLHHLVFETQPQHGLTVDPSFPGD